MSKNDHESPTQQSASRTDTPSTSDDSSSREDVSSSREPSLQNSRPNKRHGSTTVDNMYIGRCKVRRYHSISYDDSDGIGEEHAMTYAASSGLKDTLHGNIYQLQLLMFLLTRGLKEVYDFHLATEMKAAAKFDDIVFRYKKKQRSKMVCLYLQTKHRQNDFKKICASDLLNKKDEDFSLQKYFISYRKIKKHPELSKSKLGDCIFWTNSDFDFGNAQPKSSKMYLKKLKKVHEEEEYYEKPEPSEIGLIETKTPDALLDAKSSAKQSARYKFVVNEKSQLYEILKNSSDVNVLAKILAERVADGGRITLCHEIFNLYQTALTTEVIDVKSKWWSKSFIRSPSDKQKKFRNTYFKTFLSLYPLPKRPKVTVEEWVFKKTLRISETFNKPTQTDLSKHELPDDIINDEEIGDFFKELTFAVNQLNEIELGDLITDEIADDGRFNRWDAKWASAYLKTEMLNWFKKKGKEKDKEGEFITAEKSRAIFDVIQQRLKNSHEIDRLSMLSSCYLAKLEGYDVEFDDTNQAVTNFLNFHSENNVNKQALNLIAIGETLPTAIRTYQSIQRIQRCKVIFISDCDYLQFGIENLLIRAFESPDSPDLLVLECKSSNEEELKKLCDNLHVSMMNNRAKKLILITKFGGIQSKILFEEADGVSFINLTKNSRQKLLKKPIINFQGKTWISFEELLGEYCCNEIVSNNPTDFGSLIDSSMLFKLISGQEIKLGDDLTKLNFPIEHTFNQVFLEGITKCHLPYEVYAISGIEEEAPEEVTNGEQKIQFFDEINWQAQLDSHKFIGLNNARETQQFEMLCEKYSSYHYNVHWIRSESGKFIWQQSRGHITNVREYRAAIQPQNNNYNVNAITVNPLTDDDLACHDEGRKVVIISTTSATTDVEKATVLTHLARKIGKNDSGTWVIRINLKDLTEHSEIRGNFENAVDFLEASHSKRKTNLEGALLKTAIKNERKVALLFDGFDETISDYGNKVINLMQTLAKSGKLKLIVATTSNMARQLEKTLGVFSHTIEPLSIQERRDVVGIYLENELGDKFHEQNRNRLRMYLDDLIVKSDARYHFS